MKKNLLKLYQSEKDEREYWRYKYGKIIDRFNIIGAILILGLVIFLLMINLNNSNYTITKTECKNETNSSYAYSGCVLGCVTGIIGSTNKYNLSSALFICETICAEKLLKEVCKPVEVDEIEYVSSGYIPYFYKGDKEAEKLCLENNGYLDKNCSNIISPSYKNNKYLTCCYEKIIKKKSEITKEWLDNNCECQKYECICSLGCDTSNNSCGTGNKHCLSYKCGNYEVTYD